VRLGTKFIVAGAYDRDRSLEAIFTASVRDT
jgi:hypothetical protein